MVHTCQKADCTLGAAYRYQIGEGREGWLLCPTHVLAELAVYAQEVAEVRDYGQPGETAFAVQITPIA